MSDQIHENDIGTVFIVYITEDGVAVPLGTATTKEIRFRKPTGIQAIKDAEFVTDGSDGGLKYTTVTDDLTPAGVWQIQGRAVLPNGTWSSEVDEFRVHENI